MADESDVSDIVTKFLLNTCRLHPRLTRHGVLAARWCAAVAARHPPDDAEADLIPLITGSVAEFYIEPMLPLVGDVDVMAHRSDVLAIPQGHPPPTHLPAEFNRYVKVFEIVDSHLPGYVYLELRYLLTECTDDENYNYFETEHGLYAANITIEKKTQAIHGPAILTDHGHISVLPTDNVLCTRCLSWPLQAADWPTRHRNYNWPDLSTVDRVVSKGCDVVGAVHRQCRQDEWMSSSQWRLSFSRAEIVLLNSWMPMQQIVYHMLRFFMKTKQLTGSDASEALSNYHIKTLMMWACELKSSSFWTGDLNLVRVCVELLHVLSLWLSDARCRHYFISSCNLIDNSFGAEVTASQLMSIHEPWLSTWFLNNYIQKCSMLCPENVSSSFSDVSTNTKLLNVISAIIKWRLNTSLVDLWGDINYAKFFIVSFGYRYNLSLQSCTVWLKKLLETDTHLHIYFTAVAFLHVAYKISRTVFTDELMDVLLTLAGQFTNIHHHPSQCSSELSLSKATKLMKVVANSSLSSLQSIEIELSKAYLYRALKCKDSDSNSIHCLANLYLAVLYYTTGQYQTVIDHCTLVTRSQDHSQCTSHVAQGEFLAKIDDDIDNILGLTVFYQYVQTVELNQRQTQYVSVFTTELLAYYLHIRCLSVTHMLSVDDVQRFCNYFCNTQLFVADVLAVKYVVSNFYRLPITVHSSQQPSLSAPDLDTSELVELLQQSAVEHLTTYRWHKVQEFGSVATIVTTDIEALYAYKHGNYQRCLQLYTENECTLLYAVSMSSILTYPEFIQLLDDDIVSLTALTLIINPECRYWCNTVSITQLTLSLYLITQCQLKLRHSVTSLAQTLIYIEVAQGRHTADNMLDHLTLLLIKRKVLTYVKMMH